MEFFTLTLDNGLRCIHKRIKSPVAYCALVTNTGSRDESAGEHGLAHFTEHTIFKGTARRKAYQINCRLENLGGELNAFTTKEDTTVHATVMRGDFAKAAELISDVVFNATFPEHEIDKERKVIIDEINTYRDMPSDRIFDEFDSLMFGPSPLGRNILGTKSSVNRFGSEDIRNFTKRTYTPDQMVFSSIGDISQSAFERTVQKYFGQIPAAKRTFERQGPPAYVPFAKTAHHSTHQAHCILGWRAYDLNHASRLPLALIVNILGGPSANSLLNVLLRERNGLSYNIDASYAPLTDTGLASVYFSCDKDNTQQCLELATSVIDQLKTQPLSARQLSMAKRQFIGQIAVSMDSNESYMLGVGKSFLVYGEVDEMPAICSKIKAITSQQLTDIAADVFKDVSTLIYT